MSLRVGVIGAGIVGASCALELLRDGHEVCLIEPQTPGGEHCASYGNGAWLSPASVVPMSMPGLWRKVPGYLLDPQGPLTIRWRSLPALAPWLLRFLAAGSSLSRVQACARALSALLADAPARHRELAEQAGVGSLIVSSGLLYAYTDRAAFEAEALGWGLRRDNGVAWRELQGEELRAFAPDLNPRYRFGALVPSGAHCRDPGAYVAALVAKACSLGGRRVRARARGFELRAGRLVALRTDQGDLPLDRVVIAAGIASAVLARQAGDRVPLASERGYHVVLKDAPVRLPVPVMPADGKMGNTMTTGGLRLAGQVELATTDAAPDWRRATILLDHARGAYPVLASLPADTPVERWMGHRPSTPDGLPVLGPASGCADVFHAFGHGHVGLAAAPASARLVADLVSGRTPTIDVRPYRVGRFHGA